MVGAGGLLIVANLWWFATGGPQGDSLIPMRGCVLGAWLSMATGLEVTLLGATAYWRSRLLWGRELPRRKMDRSFAVLYGLASTDHPFNAGDTAWISHLRESLD